jgi:predicted Zn-dependent protease
MHETERYYSDIRQAIDAGYFAKALALVDRFQSLFKDQGHNPAMQHWMRGEILMNRSELEAAVQELRLAASLARPGSRIVSYLLFRALLQSGKVDEAVAEGSRFFSLDDRQVQAEDEYLSLFEKCKALEPEARENVIEYYTLEMQIQKILKDWPALASKNYPMRITTCT